LSEDNPLRLEEQEFTRQLVTRTYRVAFPRQQDDDVQ
jgi:hypothetical protein